MKNILKYKKIISLTLIGAALLIVGSISGYLYGKKPLEQDSELRMGKSTGFTNPLLECDLGADILSRGQIDFKQDLEDFVASAKNKNGVSHLSVYFRDLNNGPVIGVNSDESFAPASLLKVPILIAFLRYSEDYPEVLNEKVKFEKALNVNYVQKFAPEVPLVEGQTYTYKELLESMIKYSDNQALVLLYDKLPTRYQVDLYTLLGIDPNIISDPKITLSVRQYSIFFRILFNASFLSKANSEYALKILSESTFEQGIKSSVDKDLVVAHKFGERKAGNDLQQFHDCGIIYYPEHPYLLCVMTRGDSVEGLISTIHETSKFVYKKNARATKLT